jgi:monoamine oxidase
MAERIFDLAIVGAGIAGLAAAWQAIGHGLNVVVLEATDHIGGRIQTITRDDGSVWDAGAHWLLQPAINPLVREAERLGVPFRRQWRAHDRYWLDGRWLTDAEADEIWHLVDEAEDLSRDLPATGQDAPFGELLDAETSVLPVVETVMTNQYGDDPELISAIDRSRYGVFEGDWPVTGGFGQFLAELFGDIDVRLDSPVSAIDWGADVIRLDLSGEFIEARRVLITASIGVLQAGQLHFSPALLDATRDAIANMAMASQNKVAFRIDPGMLSAEPDSLAYTRREDCQVVFHLLPGGQPLVVGYVSGDLSRSLEADSRDALVEAVLGQFEAIFGADVAGTRTDAQATTWGRHPYVLGAWAYPIPGAVDARVELGTPVDGRLFFAGEATSRTAAGTVHGAYQSGIDAADRIAESLGLTVEKPFGVDNRPI